jgi:uncharacterized protein (TIGR00661 family)
MRLLYGVQATGNGHISRARAMAKYLQENDIAVDFLFSGRNSNQLFDMQCFGSWQHRRGLTFSSQAGQIDYWQSFRQAHLTELWRDIHTLDTHKYDLVITDFEPVTAWAAKKQGTPVLALGHQYAFLHKIPLQDDSYFSRSIFRHFAPAQKHIGLHWHHFNFPETQQATIAPPIIDLPDNQLEADPKRVLVYLPFEDTEQVQQWLLPIRDYQFDIYGCPALNGACHNSTIQQSHLTFHPPSVATFKKHLAQAGAVLSNAGFELISEALQWQKKILVKPLHGQMEQASNALALAQLELAHRKNVLNTEHILAWLNGTAAKRKVKYPNVAEAICRQLKNGNDFNSQALWDETKFHE